MTEKIKSRIQLKRDTSENWDKAVNFSPSLGEICIYLDADPIYGVDGETIEGYAPRLKVGDGSTKIADLPFVGDELITNEEIQSLFN